jgi:hypothetical protein
MLIAGADNRGSCLQLSLQNMIRSVNQEILFRMSEPRTNLLPVKTRRVPASANKTI